MEAVSLGHGVRESARKLGKAVKSSYIHGRKYGHDTIKGAPYSIAVLVTHTRMPPTVVLAKVLQNSHKSSTKRTQVRSFFCRFATNFQCVYFNLLSYRRPYMCLVCYIWNIICYLALSRVNIMKNMLGSKCFHKSLQKGCKKITKILTKRLQKGS